MTNEEFGSQRGFTVGRYWTHSFFIRADSLADLRPGDSDPLPMATPTHVHEYVHYLHNVSTVAGLHLFIANLWLLRSLPHCTDRYGYVSGTRGLANEQRHWVDVGRDWLTALWGGASWSNGRQPSAVKVWQFGPIRSTALTLDLFTAPHTVDLVSVDAHADAEGGNATGGTIKIGYDLISEGVAYEVDREVRRANGTAEYELDLGIEDYPYLFYRALLDKLVGRPTLPRERIAIGVYALLTSSPAAALVQICVTLAKEFPAPAADSWLLGSVVEPVLAQFRSKAMDCIDQTLKPELEALSLTKGMRAATEELYALFRAGFALRTLNPILGNNFLGRPLDGAEFTRIVGHQLLDCCVLQEGPAGSGRFEWIGPGIAASDQAAVEALASLQAATHFARLHLLKSGSFATSAQLPDTRCLFSGACVVEQSDGSPQECRTRPWTRFKEAGPAEPVCWYAAGVKSLATRT